MHSSRKHIIDHVSRLQGQLSAIQEELSKAEPDCEKAAKTLLSASRSFAGLRESFVDTFLREKILKGAKSHNEHVLQSLTALIKG